MANSNLFVTGSVYRDHERDFTGKTGTTTTNNVFAPHVYKEP